MSGALFSGTFYSVPTPKIEPMKTFIPKLKIPLFCWAFLITTGLLVAQVPVYDLGANNSGVPIPPTPGALDITNFNSAPDIQNPDGFNYFIDNGSGLDSPGETFTAPNIANLVLQSVAIEMGPNNGNGGTGPQALTLIIFSVSGTTATPIPCPGGRPASVGVRFTWVRAIPMPMDKPARFKLRAGRVL